MLKMSTILRDELMADHNRKLNFIKQKIEDLQTCINSDIERRIADVIYEITQEDQRCEENELSYIHKMYEHNKFNVTENKKRTHHPSNNNEKKKLPSKVFIVRESLLTTLLEIDHIRSIYNIFFIVLIVLLLNSVCHDFFIKGRVNFGVGTIKAGLKDIHLVIGVLCCIHIPVLSVYYAILLWSKIRNILTNQPTQDFWDYFCLIFYIIFQISLLYTGTITCLKLDLLYIPASVMLLETTRLIMKVHGFVRTNVGRCLSCKSKSTADKVLCMPPFLCYLYYLFAPTLIYRDFYPRTTHIQWKFAFKCLMEVVAIAFLYSYIYERYISVHFADYGLEEITSASLLVKLFGMIMPGFIIFLCAFYLILHSWLNFTSELLRFGDRMFYRDWWTSCNYEAFYRNWNVVVHDWLYEYIYKDCYYYVHKQSKIASSITVFLVSAYMHEHIIGFALQLFYPVMFTFFGLLGVILVFVTKDFPVQIGNIFLWFSLIIGSSSMISLYTMEYFAKQNCPAIEVKDWLDWITPMSWVCKGIVNK